MRNMSMAAAVIVLVAATTIAMQAQVQVFVPGTASGYFGNPVDQKAPLVPAVTVAGPGTITVHYLSGEVIWNGSGQSTGPNGTDVCKKDCKRMQFPLHESHGVGLGHESHLGALIGVFVPRSRVEDSRGFNAIDGTKNATRVGILPSKLFFIGEGKTFDVTESGTLFLGINDTIVSDNGGGFTVEVTAP